MLGKVKVAAIQAPAGQIAGPVGDLDLMESLTAEAAGQGARLVAWPECAYPAYFLRSVEHYRATSAARLRFDAVLGRLAAIAQSNRVYLVAGVVEERDDGRLSNAAFLFDPSGRRLLTYRKSFLWHFDNEYFAAGDEMPVVETEVGRIGLMICADGRCPELAALAGRRGVQLLVNPTAWVSWARRVGDLMNPQIEYFIPARAMENGCWILSANKVGVEADSIVYCGRSNLVDPSGRMVGSLDSAAAGVLLAEVDLDACRPMAPPPGGDWPAILCQPTDSLPMTRLCREPIDASASVVAAALAGPMDQADPNVLLADLAAQEVELLVVALANGEQRNAWVQAASRFGIMLLFADQPVVGGKGRQPPPAVQLAGGPVDSFAPARAAMLGGCELFIARPVADGTCPDLRLLRARAAENRIYVAAAAGDRAVFISPAGAVLADSLEGRAMAVVARISPAAVRDKLMAPRTDVVASRNPAMYSPLP